MECAESVGLTQRCGLSGSQRGTQSGQVKDLQTEFMGIKPLANGVPQIELG